MFSVTCAGFSYDSEMARDLIARGADIRARNRRGAEPLHAAVIGVPGSASWNPTRQRDVIDYVIEAGSNAAAAGGATPLASSCPKQMFGCCRDPPARRRRPSSPKRQRLDRFRPRSRDNRAWWHRLRRGQGRTTSHSRTARDQDRVRDALDPQSLATVPLPVPEGRDSDAYLSSGRV
jgi:hypothetical protein